MASKFIFYNAVLFALYMWMEAMGIRECADKVQGPFNNFGVSPDFLPREANQSNNNTVELRCHIRCQQNGEVHGPQFKLITTVDRRVYKSPPSDASFTITLPTATTCGPNDDVTVHVYYLEALNTSFNESIFQCGVDFNGDMCFNDSMAWITIPETTNPPTTTDNPSTTTDSPPTTTDSPTTTNNPPDTTSTKADETTEKLPNTADIGDTGDTGEQSDVPSSTIVVSAVAALVCFVAGAVLALLLVAIGYVYKARRRPKKVHAVENGSRDQETPTPSEKTVQGQDRKSDATAQVENSKVLTIQDKPQDETNSRRPSELFTMESFESNVGNPQDEHRDDND